jgi:hypothetical protein
MADQDTLPWWDDIKNLMSAIHAAFGLFGSIIRVLPMAFRPVLAALHLLYRYFVPSCNMRSIMRKNKIYLQFCVHYHHQWRY